MDGLVAGLREECGEVGAAVVGGDVTAADVVMLGITALGDLQGRAPVTLDGARHGRRRRGVPAGSAGPRPASPCSAGASARPCRW